MNSDEEDELVTDSDESDKEEANSENEQSFVTVLEEIKSQNLKKYGTPSSLSATSAFNEIKKGFKGQL